MIKNIILDLNSVQINLAYSDVLEFLGLTSSNRASFDQARKNDKLVLNKEKLNPIARNRLRCFQESLYLNKSSFSAEAYWNYGWHGVIIVSLILGLCLDWFTRQWHTAASGQDLSFYLVALSVCIWAANVESWIVGSYFGEFIIVLVLLIMSKFGFWLHRTLQRKYFIRAIS